MGRILGIIFLIVGIIATVNLVRHESKDAPPSRSGNRSYDQGNKAGRYLAPVLMFGLGLWQLTRGGGRRSTPISASKRSEAGHAAPGHGQPPYQGAHGTVASNPAHLRLKPGDWFAANPSLLTVAAIMVVIGLAVAIFAQVIPGLVIIGAAALFAYQTIDHAIHKFRQGDVCPGMVLSAKDSLVAVMTDMANGGQQTCPAMKILRQPLHKMTGKPAYDGMRVATAALYHGNATDAVWNDFSPEVINCVVHDQEEINRVFTSITDNEWERLNGCLAQIPVANPGLYRLWGDHSAQDFTPIVPWLKRRPVQIVLAACAVLATLIVVLQFSFGRNNRARLRPLSAPPPPTFPLSQPTGRPGQNDKAAYAANDRVSVLWGGRWIPGTVVRNTPGGFNYFIQLDDPQFRNPILMSTNPMRPQ